MLRHVGEDPELAHVPIRGQAPTIEGSRDFLSWRNGWKRQWENRIMGHGGRGLRG